MNMSKRDRIEIEDNETEAFIFGKKPTVHKRPMGRAPKGKEWNKHTGEWDDIEEEKNQEAVDTVDTPNDEFVWVSSKRKILCDGKKCSSRSKTNGPIQGVRYNKGKKDLCTGCFFNMPLRFQGAYIEKTHADFLSWKRDIDGGGVDEGSEEPCNNLLSESLESSLRGMSTESIYNYEYDEFYSEAKATHRFRFAMNCRTEKSRGSGILILGTRHGGDVSSLLSVGFSQEEIYVCNKDKTELELLKSKFTNVNTICGDFVQISQTRQWLGVWYDMMSTWTKNGEWDVDNMPPILDNSCVVAVTLACRKNGSDYASHCKELTELLRDKKMAFSEKGGRLSQDACIYRGGRNGKSHMVFCLATYERRSIPLTDFTGCFLKIPFDLFKGKYGKDENWVNMYNMQDDHLFATVTSAAGEGSFNVKFIGVFGFPLPVDSSWRPTAQEVAKYIFRPGK